MYVSWWQSGSRSGTFLVCEFEHEQWLRLTHRFKSILATCPYRSPTNTRKGKALLNRWRFGFAGTVCSGSYLYQGHSCWAFGADQRWEFASRTQPAAGHNISSYRYAEISSFRGACKTFMVQYHCTLNFFPLILIAKFYLFPGCSVACGLWILIVLAYTLRT